MSSQQHLSDPPFRIKHENICSKAQKEHPKIGLKRPGFWRKTHLGELDILCIFLLRCPSIFKQRSEVEIRDTN